MGCSSSRTENNENNPKLNRNQEYVYKDRENKRAISITHSIFIKERSYSEFRNEYEIMKHLGSGIN